MWDWGEPKQMPKSALFVIRLVKCIDNIVIITAIDVPLEEYFEKLFLVHTAIHY